MIDPAMMAVMAAAVSFDGLGLGLASASRGLRVTHAATWQMSLLSTGAALAGLLGGWAGRLLLPAATAAPASACLLLFLGLFLLAQSWLQLIDERVSLLLDRPERADLDHSGTIEAREALPLGLTLGLDAALLGLAGGLRGALATLALFVGLGKLFALYLGYWLGSRHLPTTWADKAAVIPAAVLLVLALWS